MSGRAQASTSGDWRATAVTLVLLSAGLLICFAILDGWAALTFAEPILGAALVAICELALFSLALALAPALSHLIYRLTSRAPR